MMFLDAVQRKISNLDRSKSLRTKSSSATTLLISKLDRGRLSVGGAGSGCGSGSAPAPAQQHLRFKSDLTKSVNRWIQETSRRRKQHQLQPIARTNSTPSREQYLHLQSSNGSCCNLKKALSSINKIATSVDYHHANAASQYHQRKPSRVENRLGGRKAVSNAQSIEIPADWLPSLTSSFQRSFSLRTTSKQKGVPKDDHKLRNTCTQQQQKCLLANRKSYYGERYLKNGIGGGGAGWSKHESHLHTSARGSLITAIFIALNIGLMLLLLASSRSPEAASISVLDPTWLRSDYAPLDAEELVASGNANNNNENADSSSQFGQVLLVPQSKAATAFSTNHQQPSASRQLAFKTLLDSLLASDANEEEGSHLVTPADDHLWIQRRRLERDRAREPPPWLRAQPMRRALNPRDLADIFSEGAASGSTGGDSIERVLDEAQPERQPVRRSPQLIEPIYENLLIPLLESAYNNRLLLDEMYSEIEARQSGAQRPPVNSAISSSLLQKSQRDQADALLAQRAVNQHHIQQKQKQQQQEANQGQSQEGETSIQNPLVDNVDPEQTLVVVGDEVSSGDDASPSVDDMPQNAASTQSQLAAELGAGNREHLGAAGNALLSDLRSPNSVALSSLSSDSRGVNEPDAAIFIPPKLRFASSSHPSAAMISLPAMSSIDSPSDLDGQQQQQQQQPQQVFAGNQQFFSEQRLPFVGSSFHVVEDIDQSDTGVVQDTDSREDLSSASGTNNDQEDQADQVQQTGGSSSLMIEKRTSRAGLNSHSPNSHYAAATFPLPPELALIEQPPPPSFGVWRSRLAASKAQLEAEAAAAAEEEEELKQQRDVSLAVRLIETRYLSESQLIQAATKIKVYLEEQLGLARGTVLGLYPMDEEQLLIKLDVRKLTSRYQLMDLIQNYDYARGYITVRWPQGSSQNPLPLLTAILKTLVINKSGQTAAKSSPGVGELEDNELDTPDDLLAAKQAAQASLERQLVPANKLSFAAAAAAALKQQQQQQQQQLQLSLQLPMESMSEQIELPVVTSQLLSSENLLEEPSEMMAQRFNPHSRISIKDLASAVPSFTPVLGAYLAALYAAEQNGRKQPGGSASFTGQLGGRNSSTRSSFFNHSAGSTTPSLVHLAGLAAVLLTTLLVVKLMMRKSDKQLLMNLRRSAGGSLRSLWSNSATSPDYVATCDAGHLSSSAASLKAAEAGNPMRPPAYTESAALDSKGASTSDSKKNVEVLVDRLSALLSRKSAGPDQKPPSGRVGEGRISEELDEASILSESTVTANTGGATAAPSATTNQPGRFRTSRSYIKSLVEALSKARSQFPAVNLLSGSTGGMAVDDDTCASELTNNADEGSQTDLEAEASEPGIMVSQMDISAAHLILSYMEKHLEDKEQLQREWRELQTTTGSGSSAGIATVAATSSASPSLAVLERLAKVALDEENRYKNRNCQVVPYDRNRVKLGDYCNSRRSRTTSAKASTSSASSTTKSDYINASYVYDDEPRRPTHIIAQGPTEQTVAQFWQMVWESGVSVLVMLTRLNENSVPMCHCYWPTSRSGNSASVSQQQQQQTTSTSSEELPIGGAPGAAGSNGQLARLVLADSNGGAQVANGATNGRRGSVTSVFNTPLARSSASGQPIIANGDPSMNNILVFEVHHNQQSLDEEPGEEEEEKDKKEKEGPVRRSRNKQPSSSGSSDRTGSAANQKSPPITTRFEVHLVSEHVSSNDYLVRNMYMINRTTGETRTITQFHYLAWPEGSVPENVKSLLQFRRKVHKSYRDLDSPILVHCSDGGGRSGTYVLVDIILERIRKGAKEIDPRATLEHLRDQRVGLCATQSQFEFVLMALAEEIQIILNALPQ